MGKLEKKIFATLLGDVVHNPAARIKYGFLFDALTKKYLVVDKFDANLKGFPRYFNALRVFDSDRDRWRQHFYKNVPAFYARSANVVNRINTIIQRIDVILQLGVLFDASWNQSNIPNIIYTDYTALLSARKPESGRSPFGSIEKGKWIELERAAFHGAAHICTRSRYVARSISTDYEISEDKISVIGAGVNLPMLPEIMLRLDTQMPTVLFIGKEFIRKGGDILLYAFAEARKQVPNCRLLLVTAEPIPSHLPKEHVVVLPATWDRKSIMDLYRRADIFVLPSRLETWGDVLLEAMAFNLPCVGVAGEAMEELIEDGRTGLVVPPGDVDALTDALTELLWNANFRRSLGRAGRHKIEEKYTWDHVVERLESVIDSVSETRFTAKPQSSSAYRR